MAGMTEDQLKAMTDNELRQAVGYSVGKLAASRQKALIYYEGLAKGDLAPPEVDGRSTVVSTDVRNIIESMLPELMAKFASSESVVEAEATKPNDEQNAKLATDYLNYLFYKKNNGHKLLLTWFKDALISKNGFVKVWWDTRVEETREDYKALDDVELAQIADDDEVEITEHTSYIDEEDQEQRQQAIGQLTQQLQQAMADAQGGNPQAQQAVQSIGQQIQQIQSQPPKMLHDITVKRSKKGGKIAIENVPPEEFLISRKAKTIEDSPFVGHRVLRTVSELKSMGYKNVDSLTSDDNGQQYSIERVERLSFDDEMPYNNTDTPAIDESQRLIWVTECYIRCDYDGDGIAELRKVVRAGNELLENEVVDCAPFVYVTPIVMPHRFFGLSIADMAMEPQRINTSIIRASMDNLYLQVNGRYYAIEGQVNLDDLLTSRPGGVVRMKQPGMAGRLDQASGDGSAAMDMLNFMRGFTEEATGWQRTANAVDNPDSLNATATAATLQMNKAQLRTDLIARNFAEGLVSLFKMMLKLICQHQDYADDVKLGDEWQSIDPREWRNQFGFTINVGLGSGSKEQQIQHLMMQLQVQEKAAQIGIATPENLYRSCVKLSESLGFKNADVFWSDPSKQPPQPPKPDPEAQKAQAQMQVEQMKASMQAQTAEADRQAEAAMERERMQLQAQVDTHRQQVEAQQKALEAQNLKELEQVKIDAQMRLEQFKAQMQQQTAIEVARINAEAQIMRAQLQASATPVAATSQQETAAQQTSGA